jgi:hypothetical protein
MKGFVVLLRRTARGEERAPPDLMVFSTKTDVGLGGGSEATPPDLMVFSTKTDVGLGGSAEG